MDRLNFPVAAIKRLKQTILHPGLAACVSSHLNVFREAMHQQSREVLFPLSEADVRVTKDKKKSFGTYGGSGASVTRS